MSTTGRHSEVPLGAFRAWGSYEVSPVFKMMDISKAMGGFTFLLSLHTESQNVRRLMGWQVRAWGGEMASSLGF